MDRNSTLNVGRIGEEHISRCLRRRRFKIRDRNMRNSLSEIDIIAENKEYIIFVEVKTRTNISGDFRPLDAVTNRKKNLIMRAATAYIRRHGIRKQPRFDVAEVYLDPDTLKVRNMNYIENAYVQGGDYAVF